MRCKRLEQEGLRCPRGLRSWLIPVLHTRSGMEHLIPTLLGIAGALAPVALGYWRQEAPAVRYANRTPRFMAVPTHMSLDEAVVRGGRVYL